MTFHELLAVLLLLLAAFLSHGHNEYDPRSATPYMEESHG